MFKVIIVGAENRGDYKMFVEKTALFLKNKIKNGILILSTGDKYIDILCRAANIDFQTYYCDWKKYGKDAIKNRNIKMLNDCDAVIIFEDGTKDTNAFIKLNKEINKPIRIVKL